MPSGKVAPAAKAEVLPLQQQTPNLYIDNFQHFPIQCKLSIGAVDDPLEDEDDAMADKVMRMPERNFIQRKCTHCEEEEKAQRKPLLQFIQKTGSQKKLCIINVKYSEYEKFTSSSCQKQNAITNEIQKKY